MPFFALACLLVDAPWMLVCDWIGMLAFVWIDVNYWNNNCDVYMKAFAVAELVKLGLVDAADVLDTTVARMPKAYPAYFGTYDRFDRIREFTDTLANLFLIGRNGQHRYNNMPLALIYSRD